LREYGIAAPSHPPPESGPAKPDSGNSTAAYCSRNFQQHKSGQENAPDFRIQTRITTKIFTVIRGFIHRPDNIAINTMIHERIVQLKSWAKETIAALKEKCAAATLWITPATSAVSYARVIIAAADGNVLDMGKRYRKTSGHAPLFSLYTFFTDR